MIGQVDVPDGATLEALYARGFLNSDSTTKQEQSATAPPTSSNQQQKSEQVEPTRTNGAEKSKKR